MTRASTLYLPEENETMNQLYRGGYQERKHGQSHPEALSAPWKLIYQLSRKQQIHSNQEFFPVFKCACDTLSLFFDLGLAMFCLGH